MIRVLQSNLEGDAALKEKQWLQAADFFADEECINRLAVALDERLLAPTPSAEAHTAELFKVCSHLLAGSALHDIAWPTTPQHPLTVHT
jgi:hypothetical protein